MIKDAWYIIVEGLGFFGALLVDIDGIQVATAPKKTDPIFVSKEHMALQISNALYELGYPNDLYNWYSDESWGDCDFLELDSMQSVYMEDLERHGKNNPIF